MIPRLFWTTFVFPLHLTAMLIGNPAEPALETQGLFTASDHWVSLRASFLEDFIYRQRFEDEFQLDKCNPTTTFAKLSTNAGMLTLNFKHRIDLYGIVGASRLQLNQEIFSKMQFSWGCGGKLIIFKTEQLYLGADLKYFEAHQKPLYFICEGLNFNVVNNFDLKYHETQASIGISYRIARSIPYIYATYLMGKIEPTPMIALVRWPLDNTLVDATCKSAINQRRWGLTVGATLLSNDKASLTVESRMFNQNAIDVHLQVCF